ncbi:MAG: MerR family transcriptional regulator [Negativicutes bacterium]|nr:MerR family transcriptional regulator [Negativicutes bacterium]
MTFTIGKLARRFNLSRSTLLYYDSIGLLSPEARGKSNYRLYSETSCQRLEQIAVYRQAGLSLCRIKELLDAPKGAAAAALEAKLEEINRQIRALRQQQHFIIQVLKSSQLLERLSVIPKDALVGLLQAAGVDEQAQWRFHHLFEQQFPERHQEFVELLGLTPGQANEIREWSRREQE